MYPTHFPGSSPSAKSRAFALAFLLLIAVADVHGAAAAAIPDRAAMMRLTVDRWISSQSIDGSLPYGFDFLADQPTGQAGNSWAYIVRQAGSFYMLAEYYRYTGERRLQEPLRRALAALDQHSLSIGKGRIQRFVERTRILSLPFARWKLRLALDRLGLLYQDSGPGKVVSPDGRYSSALAGAVAVALLAELTYTRATGDERFAELGSAWLAGLLSLHLPGGGFRDTPASIDDSDYANGEGWFALAVFCDMHRDDAHAVQVLADVDDAMLRRYSDRPSRTFFHWGAMAAEQRYKTTGDARFLRFVQGQAETFFAQFQRRVDPVTNNCSDMEGLAAVLAAMQRSGDGDVALADRIRERLASEAGKLPRLQIQSGQNSLTFAGETRLTAPRMASFSGAFFVGVETPTVRVDLAAHCLSAMVRIERDSLLAPPPK
jgi:hypothetical protein